ncbi:DUF4376 domain-containing protein [Methylocaldum sp. MU1018]
MFYALDFDQAGNVIARCVYSEEPDTLAKDQIACTEQQYRSWQEWRVQNDALVPLGANDLAARAKSAQWTAIKAERDRRRTGGIKVGTLWFHGDADSRIQYLGLKDRARDLLAAGGGMTDDIVILGQPVRWKTMNGSFANITAQLAIDIVAAAGDLDARLFAVAEMHRAAMEVADDPAAYDFSSGWPETFGG